MKMNAMKMKKIVAIFGVIGAVVLVAVGVSAQPPDRVSAPPTDRTDGAYATSARVTIPAGTVLPIVLDSYVSSDTSRLEDPVRAHVRRDVVVRGLTVIPAGSTLVGHVTSVERSGRVKGRARIGFRFDRVSIRDVNENVAIETSAVVRQAPATKRQDAAKIGIPAAGGAIVGAIAGGKKGAAIGAAAGGGAGTGVVLATRGREVRLGRGAAFTVRLLQPITVRGD
jgi:hypothetical protein